MPVASESSRRRLRRRVLTIALWGWSVTAAWAQVEGAVAVSDFAAGPGNGKYSFASSSPRTLSDAMDRAKPRPSATGLGQLMLPAAASGAARMPAVVLVHGSGGVYPELVNFWGKRLNEQGIAVFVLDIFGPRGVQSTADDQSQVPFSADLADAFGALRLLASHPSIDSGRIAVMGFSRGGTAAWRTNVNKIVAGLSGDGLRFAAHVPVYAGGCAGMTAVSVKPGVFGAAPMLFIHGDEDDYTYASDCNSFAQRIAATGTPAEFLLLAGARHKFDSDNTRRVTVSTVAKTREGCPLEFDVDARTYRDRRSDAVIALAQVAAFAKEHCSTQGATVEGNRKAREAAATAIDGFLRKVFRM